MSGSQGSSGDRVLPGSVADNKSEPLEICCISQKMLSALLVIPLMALLISQQLLSQVQHPVLDIARIERDLEYLAAERHPWASQALVDRFRFLTERLATIRMHAPLNSGMELWVDTLNDDGNSQTKWPSISYTDSDRQATVLLRPMNALVRFNSSRQGAKTLMVCAHLDSAVTSFGAYDDGLPLMVMLELTRLYATSSTPTTAGLRDNNVIFMFGTGEELGLLDAYAVLEHNWVKPLVASGQLEVVNLEAGGVGGPPMLFRQNSQKMVQDYAKVALQPHLNVVSNEVFKLGLIASDTNFRVFSNSGLRGIDLAFYQQRGMYHTRHDSFKNFNEHDAKALATDLLALLGHLSPELDRQNAQQIYFDLFRSSALLYSFSAFNALNVLLAILLPIAIFLYPGVVFQNEPQKGHIYSETSKSFGRLQVVQLLMMAGSMIVGMIIIAIKPTAVAVNFALVGWTLAVSIAFPMLLFTTNWVVQRSGGLDERQQRTFMFLAGCLHIWLLQCINMVAGFMGYGLLYPLPWWTLFLTIRMCAETLYRSRYLSKSKILTMTGPTSPEPIDLPEQGYKTLSETSLSASPDSPGPLSPTSETALNRSFQAWPSSSMTWSILLTLASCIFPLLMTIDLVCVLLEALAPTVLENSSPVIVLAFLTITNTFYFVPFWHLAIWVIRPWVQLSILFISGHALWPFLERIWNQRYRLYSLLMGVFSLVGVVLFITTCSMTSYTKQTPLKLWYEERILIENQQYLNHTINVSAPRHSDWLYHMLVETQEYGLFQQKCDSGKCAISVDSGHKLSADLIGRFNYTVSDSAKAAKKVEVYAPSESSVCFASGSIDDTDPARWNVSLSVVEPVQMAKPITWTGSQRNRLQIVKRHDQFRSADQWQFKLLLNSSPLTSTAASMPKIRLSLRCSFDEYVPASKDAGLMFRMEDILPEWMVFFTSGSASRQIVHLIDI